MSFDVSSERANDKENSKRIIDDFLKNEEFKQKLLVKSVQHY